MTDRSRIVERINQILSTENFGFPDYRNYVEASGKNVKWLKKALKKVPSPAAKEVLRLLDLL